MGSEAIASRPLLIASVASATRHAGRTTLSITTPHAHNDGIGLVFTEVAGFVAGLRQTAPRWTEVERLRRQLATTSSCPFGMKGLQGSTSALVVDGNSRYWLRG